jgi:methanogenic corrinoid protein MtbC1
LRDFVGAMDEEEINRSLDEFLASEPSSRAAREALDACRDGMGIVGERFEHGEIFVGDLILAGNLLTSIIERLKPLLTVSEDRDDRYHSEGVIVLGTVEGDLHDIGKNIFRLMAEASNFKVIDVGIDAPPDSFVRAVRDNRPDIVGFSGIMTFSVEAMKRAAGALTDAGLRKDVFLIIGGNGVSANACAYVGADAWSRNAAEAVKMCVRHMGAGRTASRPRKQR